MTQRHERLNETKPKKKKKEAKSQRNEQVNEKKTEWILTKIHLQERKQTNEGMKHPTPSPPRKKNKGGGG